jgi:pterin-4a-carbinolamine dehydratase
MRLSFYITILLALLQSGNIAGQDFAPVGAKWHYSEGFAFSENIDYLTIKSLKDTVINGKGCKKLDCDELCWNPSGIQFISYSNDSLFHYYSELDTFQLIACFSAVKGDSWKILIKDFDETIDTLSISVDSVSSVVLNEESYQQLFVSYDIKDYNTSKEFVNDIGYSSRVIEHIGDIKYLFNFPIQASLTCDMNYSSGLRCYEDSEFGFYSTGIADSCTYKYKSTGILENKIDLKYELIPNPAKNWIELHCKSSTEAEMQIFNMSGQLVQNKYIQTNSKISIANLKCGVYFIRITDSGNRLNILKLVKY